MRFARTDGVPLAEACGSDATFSGSGAGKRMVAMDPRLIREHMEVLGSDGSHVGVVDAIEGGRVKLSRKDVHAGGTHHFVDLDAVTAVDGNEIRLARPAAEIVGNWGSDARGVRPGSSFTGP